MVPHSRFSALALMMGFMAILLCGCWDRTETNDIAFVLSSSVDLEKDGSFRLSFLLPLPGQMGGANGGGGGTSGGKSYYIDSAVGSTYREATSKLQRRMARRLFLAHRRTVIVGEELAKKGIGSLFDVVPRTPESRLTTFLIIAKGYGYDLLNTQPQFERFPAEAIRELSQSSFTIPISFKDVGATLSFKSDPIISYMEIKESEKGLKPSKEVQVQGYAQFRNDKMVGVFKGESAFGLMLLSNKLRNHLETFPINGKNHISIMVKNGKTKITPVLLKGKLSFDVKVEMKGTVKEDVSGQDLNNAFAIHHIEKLLADKAKKSIQEAIQQMKSKETDSVQLGLLVWRKYPHEWKNGLENNWKTLLKQADFRIQVETSITDTGLIDHNVIKEGMIK